VVDRLFDARVRGQFGLVTWQQCRAAGLSTAAIVWKLESGRWTRLHPGVYLTTPGRDDWQVSALAALLACGRGAALSHQSAAFAWGMLGALPSRVRVVVPAERHVCPPQGVLLRRSRPAVARTHATAWPHRTTVEHTLLDLAQEGPLDSAISRIARALQQRQTTPMLLRQALAQRPRQRHGALLLEALGEAEGGAESTAEIRYVRDVERAHGLPVAVRQAPTGDGGRRDNEYEGHALIVEVDGRLGHEGWHGRRRDGRRDRAAARAGRLSVRVFWDELVQTPCDLAVEVAELLRARGWRGRLRPCRRRGCAVRRLGPGIADAAGADGRG
jgi:hypothetical protein